ncbi:hypothetical protein HDV05_007077 [Chytridiales sp. JEL 0842]|nr:hypothetical protein HDV05_007077 [Chytridiales sp. JEL 0842]
MFSKVPVQLRSLITRRLLFATSSTASSPSVLFDTMKVPTGGQKNTPTQPNKLLSTNEHKKLIDLLDQLRKEDVNHELSLPRIAVVGNQSSGKSSVLEGISGISFPRGQDLCTAFPTQIVMRSASTFSASVSAEPEHSAFEKRTYDTAEDFHGDFENLVDQAKKAFCPNNTVISSTTLVVELHGPEMPDLTLIDLPGYVASAVKDQPATIVQDIQSMVDGFITDPRTIILAILPANNDLANNYVFTKIKELDPDSERTIGVLTKLDLVEKNESNYRKVLEIANNQGSQHLTMGYFAVLNRSQKDIDTNQSREAVLAKEASFFSRAPWNKLAEDRRGTSSLVKCLSDVLGQKAFSQVPFIHREIVEKQAKIEAEFNSMVEPIDADNTYAVVSLLFKSANEVKKEWMYATEGLYTFSGDTTVNEEDEIPANRLRAKFNKHGVAFSSEVSTARSWKFVKIDKIEGESAEDAAFRKLEVHLSRLIEVNKGRELPGVHNMQVIRQIMNEVISLWETAAMDLVNKVVKDIRTFLNAILSNPAIIDQRVAKVAAEKVEDAVKLQLNKVLVDVSRTCAMERQMGTLNHYFSETLTKKRQERVRARLEAAAKNVVSLSYDRGNVEPFYEINQASLSTNFFKSNEEYERIDMADVIESYRKTAMKRFVDAICFYSVEGHLFYDFPSVLEKAITSVSAMQVRDNPMVINKRKKLQRSLETLKRCRESLDKFRMETGL